MEVDKINKKLNLLISALVVISTLFILSSTTVSAATDPFQPNLNSKGYINPTNTYPNGQCTWFAWGRAYEKGVSLPHYGNAVKWWSATSKGSTPKANSIAVWSDTTYGHVAYIERVDGQQIFVNEANYNTYPYGGGYDGKYKILTPAAMQTRGKYNQYKLLGYIYLPIYSPPTLIRMTGATEVYHIDMNGYKASVPTANVFNSWKWDWNLINSVTQTQLNSYPTAFPPKVVFNDGTFIKYNGQISIIQGGLRCAFANWQAYLNHGGYSNPTVLDVTASEYSLNAPGPIIYK